MRKKITGMIAAFFLIGLLLLSTGFPAKADAGNVTMSESNDKLSLSCDRDLFTSFKNMTPGRTAGQTIRIMNTCGESLDLYLRAENADASHINSEEQQVHTQ